MSDDVEWADVGERMREARLTVGLTQEELGARIGLDRTMIAKIESGNRRIDARELIRLSSALQVPVDYLLRPALPVLSHRASVITEDTDTEVARESERLEVALVTWLHEVRQLIELGVLHAGPLLQADSAVTSSASARDAALWVRRELGCGLEAIDSLLGLCERAGQFVLVAEIPGDGASVLDGEVAAAVVSLRGDPARRRATAAHELGHLVIGDEYSSDLGVHASRADREAVIDAFAAELLLPSQILTEVSGAADGITRDQLIGLAALYRTSWSLAIRQADQAGVLNAQGRREWGRSAPTRGEFMEAVGWAPQPDLEGIRVPPGYAHAVIEAWRRGRLTAARAVELMHGQINLADLPPRAGRPVAEEYRGRIQPVRGRGRRQVTDP